MDVGDLARSVVASLAPLAAASGTSLRATVDPSVGRVNGAPAALRRALVALVDNAISHTPDGSVVVRVTGDPDVVRIAVADDGEGLDPADTQRLTERFSRGARAPDSPGGSAWAWPWSTKSSAPMRVISS